MLMIRLQRIGRKHDPAFRVVVTEKTSGPKSGKFIERVGFYHAKTGEKAFNKERIIHWISNGAQLSGTVHNFLVDEGVVKGSKINVLPKRKEVEEKQEEAQSAPAQPAPVAQSKEEAQEAPQSQPKEEAQTVEDKKEEKEAVEEEKPA